MKKIKCMIYNHPQRCMTVRSLSRGMTIESSADISIGPSLVFVQGIIIKKTHPDYA